MPDMSAVSFIRNCHPWFFLLIDLPKARRAEALGARAPKVIATENVRGSNARTRTTTGAGVA